MGNLLQTTLPVFGLILLGYVVGWAGVIDRAGIRGLSRFTFRIAIPVLLVRSMANVALSGPVEWPLMAAYYGATLVMYAAGMGAGRWIFSQPLEQQAIFGLGASFSNLVVLGLPIVLVVYGNEGELPMYMILSCNAAVLFFLASSVQGIARGVTQPRQGLSFIVLKTHATNPVIVALAIGLVLNLLGFRIAGPLDAIAAMLGSAALPCALFTVGASLSRYRLAGELREAMGLILLKNVFHPLITFVLAFTVFDLSATWAGVAVILAAQPTGVIAYLFAEDSETLSSTIGATVVLSTMVSIVSVSVVLYLLS